MGEKKEKKNNKVKGGAPRWVQALFSVTQAAAKSGEKTKPKGELPKPPLVGVF